MFFGSVPEQVPRKLPPVDLLRLNTLRDTKSAFLTPTTSSLVLLTWEPPGGVGDIASVQNFVHNISYEVRRVTHCATSSTSSEDNLRKTSTYIHGPDASQEYVSWALPRGFSLCVYVLRFCRCYMSRHAPRWNVPFCELFMILSLHCPFVCKHLTSYGRA